ncbi:MAG: hypothetical protein WC859_04940 [Elusimicrobiota bacterium]|jgi:hypothetical protein
MNRWLLTFLWLMAVAPVVRAAEEDAPVPAPQGQEEESAPPDEEGEEKGIIPRNAALYRSTQPVTPVTNFPEKPAYDLAREELARAQALSDKGEFEASSDTALEAYDDLMTIRRRTKSARKKLRAERHQAATIYVQAGILFINGYVRKEGSTAKAMEEGRSRFEDLRDVACNYPELNRALNKAIDQFPAPKP